MSGDMAQRLETAERTIREVLELADNLDRWALTYGEPSHVARELREIICGDQARLDLVTPNEGAA